MRVRVTDAIDNDRTLLGGKNNNRNKGNDDSSFYVAFRNPEDGVKGDDEESLDLKQVGAGERQWQANVNLRVPVDTPLKADVYRRRWGLPAKFIGSAIFGVDKLDTVPKLTTVDTILVDPNGQETRAVIELDLKQESFKDVYVRKKDEEEEKHGGLQGSFLGTENVYCSR